MKKYFRYLLITAIIAFAASCGGDDDDGTGGGNGGGTNPPEPSAITLQKKEMRGAWIATVWSLDWPQYDYNATSQKKKYTDLLDKLVESGVNAVFVQVRPNGDAFYNSPYEPWSKWITNVAGKDPGYDVLDFMLKEAHARDLEFHAWLNPYRIETRESSAIPFSTLDTKIKQEWIKDYDRIRIYNPALPEVQERITNIVKDIITKYDVDGIHIDDYFYPDPAYYTSLDDDKEYADYGSDYSSIVEFRKGNVDKVIKKIYDVVVQNKPDAVFSVSPAGNNNYNVNSLYANVTKWCQEGWVDIIIPQIYYPTGTTEYHFNSAVTWWPQYSYKAVCMVGYGLHRFGDSKEAAQFQTTSELVEQFRLANAQSKVQGSIMYSAKYFQENKLGIIDVLKNQIYKNPSVIPFAGRKIAANPSPASNVTVNSNKLKWNAASGLRTVIYKVADKKGTVVGITSEKEFTLQDKGDYCLTTLNVDNVESAISDIVSYK